MINCIVSIGESCGLEHQMTALALIFFMIMLARLITATTVLTKDDEIDESLIDFEAVKEYQAAIKTANDNEFETTFSMYLDVAGFEGMFDRYAGQVHSAIEKRLQEADLIIKE
jgi:hypothetical protein